MIEPSYFKAVYSLVGGKISGPEEGPIGNFIFDDGQVPPTESEIQTEIIRLQSEYDAQEYARNRQAEYPDWGTQLNKIYDDGVTKWKAEMVDPIKAKYPKP